MIEVMIETFVDTWLLMIHSEIVVDWFVITTTLTTAYAMKTNHLDFKRLSKYAALFLLLFIGIVGPAVNYAVVVRGLPLTTPSLWVWPTFIFIFFTCLMLGFFLAFSGKKILDLFFDDFHLSVAKFLYTTGNSQLQKSKAYTRSGATTLDDIYRIAGIRQAHSKIKPQMADK